MQDFKRIGFTKTKTKALFGEGSEEKMFFTALVNFLKLESTINVAQYGGKNALRKVLSAVNMIGGLEDAVAIGITRDADDNFAGAEQSVAGAITAAEFPAYIATKSFIVAGTGKTGALETLCIEAIRDTPAWECVEKFEKCLDAGDTKKLSGVARDKRLLQAWLSAQKVPGLRLGEAAQKGFLPLNSPAFDELKNFLRAL